MHVGWTVKGGRRHACRMDSCRRQEACIWGIQVQVGAVMNVTNSDVDGRRDQRDKAFEKSTALENPRQSAAA